ncbi:hypothetical protein DFH09DRAFT_1212853 [Mycena vulgaris]|nr:hypothetical protein DFH09DRAFT_1212853 [Mycena vulgaris]
MVLPSSSPFHSIRYPTILYFPWYIFYLLSLSLRCPVLYMLCMFHISFIFDCIYLTCTLHISLYPVSVP